MRTRWMVGGAVLLAAVCSAAQNDRALEQDLSNHYIGKTFDTSQAYLNREVWYDQDGNITENPTPVCDNLYGRLAITRIHVRGGEVDVEATRSGKHPPMMGGRPVWPTYATREVTLRFTASGGWSADAFERAFQNSLHPRGKFDPLPPGGTSPPQDSDRRISFFLDGEPVYRVGNGVTAPRALSHLDPQYSESARRAKAGGIVLLRFIVNEDGSTSHVTAAQPPLGFSLDENAVEAAQRWAFSPALLEGKPVKVDLRAETTFCVY